MRIVHVAPRLVGRPAEFPAAVRELAAAQAALAPGLIQLVAASSETRHERCGELELRQFRCDRPRLLGRSRALRRHLGNCPHEIVHAHCIGQRPLHYALLAAQRHGAPLVISPAGALGLGPRERLHLRCLLQRALIHAQALEHAAGWHATSAEEADAIRACGFAQPVCIAPPGVDLPSADSLDAARRWWRETQPALAQAPVALCHVKGRSSRRLHRLLEAWPELAPAEWRLLLVAEQPTHIRGPASRLAQQGAASRIHLVPTDAPLLQSIARLYLDLGTHAAHWAPTTAALAAGVPALVAADIPWRRLAVEQAGWCVPWREFLQTLARTLALAPALRDSYGRNARSLAEREFSWTRSAERLLAFYRNLRG